MPKLSRFALSLLAVTLVSTADPAWAKDPFRATKARPIPAETATAFDTLFREGNFRGAIPQIEKAIKANDSEPLAHTMRALVEFFRQDMNAMRRSGQSVKQRAQALIGKDKLRGHLYLAIADLIEASYLFKTEGISGVPRILPLVQNVFDEMKNAQKIDPTDPELNLLKGLMDILISSVSSAVIPSTDVEASLANLRQFSAPDYLKWGGITVAYRDARKTDLALEAVDKALASAPNNPVLHYFKGQIFWVQGNIPEARRYYLLTLSKSPQLPDQFVKDVLSECVRMTGKAGDCQVLPQ
jgi:tetratricopeptide (TPR) repeat protein